MIPVMLGVVAIALGATVPAIRLQARRRAVRVARARAQAAYERLGFCVETLYAAKDDIAAQALADASERWNTCGALLAGSGSAEEAAVAEATAHEGLGYVAQACRRLGMPVPEDPAA